MSTSSSIYMNHSHHTRASGASSPAAASRGSQRSVLSMDEAYRRLGHRLSQRVSDGYTYRPRQVAVQMGSHPMSAFSCGDSSTDRDSSQGQNLPQHKLESEPNSQQNVPQFYDRTAKVAKVRYTDHGSHQKKEDSLLKKLTLHAKDTFRRLEAARKSMESQERKGTKKRHSPTDSVISPQRQAMAQLVLEEGKGKQQQQQQQQPQQKGLLQSVLEDNSSRTLETGNLALPKCLTSPKEPVSNSGHDNVDGNLIVMEGDVVRSNNVHGIRDAVSNKKTKSTSTTMNFRVLSLLGQGTFAQVFCCECLETGEKVALKVVKNKPAYTRQAAVEIDVFRALSESKKHMVQLQHYFMYRSHLCLVFELLGLNLYEVLKRRQFRGLPLATVRTLLQQAMEGVKDLSQKSIVHCDLKPENILLTNNDQAVLAAGETQSGPTKTKKQKDTKMTAGPIGGSVGTGSTPSTEDTRSSTQSSSTSSKQSEDGVKIKLIDFGSACFEGNTSHTYIQSRFYRSPEVLVGLPYDSAIDMWSLGCVAAELYLGLPILPGVHEHDQLGRICEMIGVLPDWMLDQGSKSTKYFAKQFHKSTDTTQRGPTPPPRTPSPSGGGTASPSPPRPTWRIKTQQEYIQSLSASEIQKKGGLAKLEKQPTNRYFKRKKLSDIVMLHGHANDEKGQLGLFVHFLLGILDPDPWKRWTALQASQHPFISGSSSHRRRTEERTSREFDIYWVPPWDPSICRRKLLNVQKTREKQQAMRRNFSRTSEDSPDKIRRDLVSPTVGGSGSTSTSRVTAMTDAMSLSRHSNSERTSPPSSLGVSTSNSTAQSSLPAPHTLTGSLGSAMAVHQTDASGVSLPPSNYIVPSSSSYEMSHPGEQRLPSSMMVPPTIHGVSFGEMQQGMLSAAQSLSGLSYEGIQVPVDADFGYALQRPGVVPGSGAELSGSYSSLSQQAAATLGFSPHHHLPPRRASGVAPVRNAALLRSAMSSSGASLPSSSAAGRRRQMGLVPQSPRQYMPSTTVSIQEDSSDFGRSAGGSSLLSQQLEEVAAVDPNAAGQLEHFDGTIGSLEAQIHLQQQQQQQMMHGGYMNQNVYGLAPPAAAGGYYTYVSANGTPIMSALPPGNMMPAAMAPASMNHLTGSYEHMQVPLGSLGVYAPSSMQGVPMYPASYGLDQPSENYTLRQAQQHAQAPPQQQQQQRQSRQEPSTLPPQYRGLSM